MEGQLSEVRGADDTVKWEKNLIHCLREVLGILQQN